MVTAVLLTTVINNSINLIAWHATQALIYRTLASKKETCVSITISGATLAGSELIYDVHMTVE